LNALESAPKPQKSWAVNYPRPAGFLNTLTAWKLRQSSAPLDEARRLARLKAAAERRVAVLPML
jgi:hypothetical protein